MLDKRNVADRLREYRLLAGLSQEALAERAGISARAISDIERGLSSSPRPSTIALLADALGLSENERGALLVPEASKPARADNLPLQLTSFVGRRAELAALQPILRSNRLVTLVGSGGVGKTRLALQLASQVTEEYRDGIFLIELATLSDSERVANAFGAALGVDESEGTPLSDAIVETLKPRRLLLIVDNCEHIIADCAPLIATILKSAPEVHVLATSREPLEVYGETMYRIDSLGEHEAAALFVDRARSADGSFSLNDANGAEVVKLCKRLDGIPLAIELAAARVRVLSIEQLAARLDDRFLLLTGGKRTALPRQQTLRALIDWSYDLLDDRERRLLRRLAVFVGDFSVDAATNVCADERLSEWEIFETLASLANKSLVTTVERGSVVAYRLLETTHAYALEKLNESDELALVRGNHAKYYATLAERIDAEGLSSTEVMSASRSMEPELENVRCALAWTLDAGNDVATGIRLLTALQVLWDTVGLSSEAMRHAERALALGLDVPPEQEAALWLTLARCRVILVMPSQALDAATRARRLFEKVGNLVESAEAARLQGIAQMRLTVFDKAEELLESALGTFREAGHLPGISRTLLSLCTLYQLRGRFEEAYHVAQELLSTARARADERTVRKALVGLAEIEFALGDAEGAVAHARESLANTPREDAYLRIIIECNLTAYLIALGQMQQARDLALSLLQSVRSKAMGVLIATAVQHLAAVVASEEPRRAAMLLGYAEGCFNAMGANRERTERFTYERALHELEAALVPDDLSALLAQGAAMNEDEVIALVR